MISSPPTDKATGVGDEIRLPSLTLSMSTANAVFGAAPLDRPSRS